MRVLQALLHLAEWLWRAIISEVRLVLERTVPGTELFQTSVWGRSTKHAEHCSAEAPNMQSIVLVVLLQAQVTHGTGAMTMPS